MIVVEHILRDSIVAAIPEMRIADNLFETPKFGWGNKEELNRWLELKKEGAYPLIWLLPTSDKFTNRGKFVEKECVFIIATRENKKDLFNDQRYQKAFDLVLNPLAEVLIKELTRSKSSDLLEDNWTLFKHPNYSETDKEGIIDLWDAIKLTIKVKFNENCN